MSLPFKSKRVRVVVDETLITVAELTNIVLFRKGGVEPSYGMKGSITGPHSDRRHAQGKKAGRFAIRRWFKAGTSTHLFFHLHNNDILFDIEQYLNGVFEDGDFIGIRLLNCESYNYKLITGSANDIIGEEISGSFTAYEKIQYEVTDPDVEYGEGLMFAGKTDGATSNVIRYHCPNGETISASKVTDAIEVPMPFNCTLKNLYVRTENNGLSTGGATVTITVMKNGVATTLTVTMTTPDQTGLDSTHEISINTGDRICVSTISVTDTPIVSWGIEVERTVESIEGNYTGYTMLWKRSTTLTTKVIIAPERFHVAEDADSILLLDGILYHYGLVKLSDGSVIGDGEVLHDDYHSRMLPSLLVKYQAFVINIAGKPNLRIYKNGVFLENIDLDAVCGWTELGRYYSCVFSGDGKYLYVSESNTADEFALFEGA